MTESKEVFTDDLPARMDEFHRLYDAKIEKVCQGLSLIPTSAGVKSTQAFINDLHRLQDLDASGKKLLSSYDGDHWSDFEQRHYHDGDSFIEWIRHAHFSKLKTFTVLASKEAPYESLSQDKQSIVDAYRILAKELIPAWKKIPESKPDGPEANHGYLQQLSIDLAHAAELRRLAIWKNTGGPVLDDAVDTVALREAPASKVERYQRFETLMAASAKASGTERS